MLLAMLTMVVSRRRVLLRFLMLPVGMMVGRLQVMVCGRMMVSGSLMMMLNGWVLGLLCHSRGLLQGFRERWPLGAQQWASISRPMAVRDDE
jgi:hypothetical protein